MPTPIHNESEEMSEFTMESLQALTNLTNEYFVGEDEEMLNKFLSIFSITDINQLFGTILSHMDKKIDLNDLNHTNIEELDLIGIAKEIFSSLEPQEGLNIELEEVEKIDTLFKNFVHFTLHDVAFPTLVAENPNVALSAKNLLKRTIASLAEEENKDISILYDQLDIENLPTEVPNEIIVSPIETVNNTEEIVLLEVEETARNVPMLLFCELSSEHVIYLAYTLANDYAVIKNWKRLFYLFKSNGRKYDEVIVDPNKIGLLLSIIEILYEKRDVANTRYLSTNRGKAIWPFFQSFLLDSTTYHIFERDLRQLSSENGQEDSAKQIIEELFDSTKQIKISNRVKEIMQNTKL